MSGPVPASLLLPPLPRAAVRGPGAGPPARRARSADTALFDLSGLRLEPTPQRLAALDAEETTPVQAKLAVGPADDAYEREADAVADRVMREPSDDLEETADDAVQPRRKCAACAAEDEVRRQVETEKEDAVQARRECAACAAEDRVQRRSVAEAEAQTGPPELAASPGELTSGGSPLPEATRGFYESRLGRDLSGVRLHTGTPAQALSESINARAFTYGSHVWLGEGGAGPSHTLSHELTHVLQQTQTRSLADDDAAGAAAGPRVQREPYWIPTDTHFDTPTKSHDVMVDMLGGANPTIITEAPIPNAGRTRRAPGFADLFKAEPARTIGVKLGGDSRGAPPRRRGMTPVLPPVIRNFDEDPWWSATGHDPRQGSGSPQPNGTSVRNRLQHSSFGRPVVDEASATIQGLSEAPGSIEIGEVKAGFQSWPRQSAEGQLRRYGARIDEVAAAVNEATGNPAAWIPDPEAMRAGPIRFPAGSGPNSTPGVGSLVKPLVLKRSGGDRNPFRRSPAIDGHLIVGADPSHTGVFNYFWRPRDLPAAAALAGAASSEWGDMAVRYEALIHDLQGSPKNVRRKVRARRREPLPHRSRRQAWRLQRAPRAYGDDPFNHRIWERRRTALGRDFRSYGVRHPSAFQNTELVAQAQDTELLMQRRLSGYRARRETGATGRRLRQFARLRFLVGTRGRLVGWLRRIFGRAYVQMARAYQRISDRFRRRMRAPRGVGGIWIRAAFMALVKALAAGAGIVLGRAMALLAGRIEGCMDQKMAEVFAFASEDLDLSAIEERIAEIETHATRLQQIAQTEANALAEQFLGPYGRVFDDLQTALQAFSALSTVASLVQWGVRVAVCAAPPVAGCLWNLAIGALELVLSQIMQSCWFLRKVMPYALQLDFLRELPQTLADGLLDGLRAVLPEALHGFLCLDEATDEVREVAAPTEAELRDACEDGPRARQPVAPQHVVERIDDLAAMDPAVPGQRTIRGEFARWAAINGVPQNTEIPYEDFIAALDDINARNMGPAELREALARDAEDEDIYDPLADFVGTVRDRGAATAARNERVRERRRRQQAAEEAAAAAAESGREAEGEQGGGSTPVVAAEILEALPAGESPVGRAPVNPQFPRGGGSQFGRLHTEGNLEPGDPIRISLYYWINDRWVVLRNIQAEYRGRTSLTLPVMGGGEATPHRILNYALLAPIYFRAPEDTRIFQEEAGDRSFYLDYAGIVFHAGLVGR